MNDQRTPRVAIVADDIGPAHGAPWTLAGLREQPIPGYAIDIVRSERSIDAWTVRRPDLVHLGARGPTTDAARTAARALGLRTVVSHHLASAPDAIAEPRLFLSPSAAADHVLHGRGVDPSRIARWEPGVDLTCFHPGRYAPDALPEDTFTVLYAGPLAPEHGLVLLTDAFLLAREHNPRLHLVIAGEGQAERTVRAALGDALTALGPVGPEQLRARRAGSRSWRPTPGRRVSWSRPGATAVSSRRSPGRWPARSSASPAERHCATGS